MTIICNFCFKPPPATKVIIAANKGRAHICEDCVKDAIPIIEEWHKKCESSDS